MKLFNWILGIVIGICGTYLFLWCFNTPIQRTDTTFQKVTVTTTTVTVVTLLNEQEICKAAGGTFVDTGNDQTRDENVATRTICDDWDGGFGQTRDSNGNCFATITKEIPVPYEVMCVMPLPKPLFDYHFSPF